MCEIPIILRLFQNFCFGAKSKQKWLQFCKTFRPLEDNTANCLKYVFPKNKILNSFIYLTFIGLGANNNQSNKTKLGEIISKDEWKREKNVSQHIALAEFALKVSYCVHFSCNSL